MLVDWTFWGSGIILGIFGLWLMYRAMFADRSRGRRRCPKCWYDMSGTESLRCPECGRAAKTEKSFYKARRRWRLTLLGVMLMFAGLGLGWGRQIQQLGLIRATPATVLVVLMPYLEDNAWRGELLRRAERGVLRKWEYRLFVDRCVGILESSEDTGLLKEAAHILARIELTGRTRTEREPWRAWVLASELNPESVAALAGLLEHEDPEVRFEGIKALDQFKENTQIAMPALLAQLASDDSRISSMAHHVLANLHQHFDKWQHISSSGLHSPPPGRNPSVREFYAQFQGCGVDLQRAVPILKEGLTHESERVRVVSIWGLAVIESQHGGTAEPILDLVNDRSGFVRKTLLAATSVLPVDDRVERILTNALESNRSDHWTALRATELHGLEAREMIPVVEALMLPGTLDQVRAILCYVRIGGDPDRAVEMMVVGLEAFNKELAGKMWGSPEVLLKAVAELELKSVELIVAVSPFLESNSFRVRMAAATAMIMIGGDAEGAMRLLVAEHIANPLDWQARIHLDRICGRDRVPETVMTEMFQSDDPQLRAVAAYCINWGVDGTAFRDRLAELMNDPNRKVAENATMAFKRVEALAKNHD
ncbi:MAG: HEAT repeat domain-containing protein [Planctomycetes bacterium]|nr:HEAT repeat domain-containing protein [Planctomycetota bacterium]